jgi:hypothetical protein
VTVFKRCTRASLGSLSRLFSVTMVTRGRGMRLPGRPASSAAEGPGRSRRRRRVAGSSTGASGWSPTTGSARSTSQATSARSIRERAGRGVGQAWCSTSTVPLPPSTRTRSPLCRRMVALPHPTTAGMPSSRARSRRGRVGQASRPRSTGSALVPPLVASRIGSERPALNLGPGPPNRAM